MCNARETNLLGVLLQTSPSPSNKLRLALGLDEQRVSERGKTVRTNLTKGTHLVSTSASAKGLESMASIHQHFMHPRVAVCSRRTGDDASLVEAARPNWCAARTTPHNGWSAARQYPDSLTVLCDPSYTVCDRTSCWHFLRLAALVCRDFIAAITLFERPGQMCTGYLPDVK